MPFLGVASVAIEDAGFRISSAIPAWPIAPVLPLRPVEAVNVAVPKDDARWQAQGPPFGPRGFPAGSFSFVGIAPVSLTTTGLIDVGQTPSRPLLATTKGVLVGSRAGVGASPVAPVSPSRVIVFVPATSAQIAAARVVA